MATVLKDTASVSRTTKWRGCESSSRSTKEWVRVRVSCARTKDARLANSNTSVFMIRIYAMARMSYIESIGGVLATPRGELERPIAYKAVQCHNQDTLHNNTYKALNNKDTTQ